MELFWSWAVSTTGFIIVLYLGMVDEVIVILTGGDNLPTGYVNEFMISALQTKVANSFVPILAVIPFSGKYVEDLKSKFVRFYLVRSSRKSYLLNRISGSFACGGTVFFCGGTAAWSIASLFFTPMEKTVSNSGFTTHLLLNLIVLFLVGGMWSVVGMTISSFMESQYIAYTSPFIIYYLLFILCERYFPNAALLYTPNWTNSDVWPFGALGAAIFLLELTAICGIIFIIRAGKRLQEL